MIKGESRNFLRNTAFIIALAIMLFFIDRSEAKTVITDNKVTEALKIQVQYDSKIGGENLSINTKEGIVILKGELDNLLAKERLIQAVSITKGIKAFIDLVKVVPEQVFPDDILTLKIENHLLNNPVTESYEIEVRVRNSEAVLNGQVNSLTEKIQAENTVKSISGVKAVKNNLTIVLEPKRLDSEIKSEITAKIKNDMRVDAYLMDVKVENGHVFISGVVGSEYALKRLNAISVVPGVKNVNTEKVTVKKWARNEMLRTEESRTLSDMKLKEIILKTMTLDPRVYAYDLEVEVESSEVTLRGSVNSEETKMAASMDAGNVRGVKSVKNNIKVITHEAVPSNDELSKRVNLMLLEDKMGSYSDVDVYAFNGLVYLLGTVKTEYLADRAEKLIRDKISGVISVYSGLSVQYEENTLPTWMVEANIKRSLESHPFVNGSRIDVQMNEKAVSLEGSVQTFAEFHLAEEICYKSGAKAVLNNLSVTLFSQRPTASLK